MKVAHNFNAGPCVLPKPAIESAIEAIRNFDNTGIGILEISHRTPGWERIMIETEQLWRDLLHISDDYAVIFLGGGASTQFYQVAANLMNHKAAYLQTGVWAKKAAKEAKLYGEVAIVASSEDKNYSYIPKGYEIPKDADYLHITTNNTIYGTQWQHIPFTSNSMVADMSSDILSRQLPFNKFDLIYAGAQKNLGAAGVNIVVVNKNILGKVKRRIPTMMDYRNHIAEQSILNTPPVFAVYVCLLTLRWLKAEGGVQEMERRNNLKAEMLYSAIDQSKIFKGTAAKDDRSKMNVCFVMDNEEQEKQFLTYTQSLGIVGIKGHRSVGGFRASLYNALESSSVEVLVNAMKHFEENN